MAAGHSLGEFSALVASGALSFEEGLKLVIARANAMQKACEARPSAMAAILGLDDKTVEDICAGIDGTVVPANRSEEHTSELQSLMRTSYAVFCLKKQKSNN